MITLTTGLPGAAKTLYTLTTVDFIAKRDSRPVFYSGITDVTLPGWTEVDAEKWFDCPPGSIVVIDECQRIFRPRTISKDVPRYVSELETHRHKGIDLYMITQHPMLADSALRRLSGRHLHVVRVFGMQQSTIHEWGSVKDNCDKSAGRADSIKTRWRFDRKMFGSYKSAEVHTVKRAIPFRVKMFICLPFIIAGLGFMIYRSFEKKTHPAEVPGVASAGGVVASGGKLKVVDALADAKQFVFERTPRVVGLALTAPRYDEITKPTVAPVPVACVASAHRCQCYSQQGTKLDVQAAMCKAIAADGFFQDFDVKGKQELARSERDGERRDLRYQVSQFAPGQTTVNSSGSVAGLGAPVSRVAFGVSDSFVDEPVQHHRVAR